MIEFKIGFVLKIIALAAGTIWWTSAEGAEEEMYVFSFNRFSTRLILLLTWTQIMQGF